MKITVEECNVLFDWVEGILYLGEIVYIVENDAMRIHDIIYCSLSANGDGSGTVSKKHELGVGKGGILNK